jgi:hypothetical protein
MAIKIEHLSQDEDEETESGTTEDSSVTIGTGDLVNVHMPNGQHYEVTEIFTIDARTDGPDGPGRVMHNLTLAEESYYERSRKEAETESLSELDGILRDGGMPVLAYEDGVYSAGIPFTNHGKLHGTGETLADAIGDLIAKVKEWYVALEK